MVKKKTKDEISVPDAKTPPSLPVDEFHGQGGSYVFDTATGKRTRAQTPALEVAQQAEQQSEIKTETVSNEGQ